MTTDTCSGYASTCHQLHAISRPVYDLLRQASWEDRPFCAHPMARFRRALNLTLAKDGGEGNTVIALITPELVIGPFHMVVDDLPPPLDGAPCPVWWEEDTLRIGAWALQATADTRIWEPAPNWEALRVQPQAREKLSEAVKSIRQTSASEHTATATTAAMHLPQHPRRALSAAIATADLVAVRASATELSGLGPGLTPAGDDYLAGRMLALWMTHHPEREELCGAISGAAAGRTTRLSRAFLEAAGRGEANESWHELFAALSERGGATARVSEATRRVSAYGATSGLDMLTGFVEGLGEQVCRRLPE